jgi:membrane protein DedA with SNARE-associated domain
MHELLQAVGRFTETVITSMGYPGIVLLMGIESACIPLPSELIMPYSGYLVYKGHFGLWEAGVAGAAGCVVGSITAYYLGAIGGRPLVERYGRYVLVSRKDLARADAWFERWGLWATFIARLLPVIRTFISFPAGVARVAIVPFSVVTFLGSLPWCTALAWVGMKLAERWLDIKTYFHGADVVIGAALLLGAVWWVWHGITELRREAAEPGEPSAPA